jgi:deoxyribonuclease V
MSATRLKSGRWPETITDLEAIQEEIGRSADSITPWTFADDRPAAIGGVFIAYRRGLRGAGERGEPAWMGAAVYEGQRRIAVAALEGRAAAPYIAGYLALREGALLESAARQLIPPPDVLLVDATGRDHPRRAGLALHLGTILDLPTVGVTDRTLVAVAEQPGPRRGDRAPLQIGDELVGFYLRTRDATRPLFVHAGWRTSPQTACETVLAATSRHRTPEPLRESRRLARDLRNRAIRMP